MENRARFIALARACYGPRWQTDAARAIAVSDRTVRAYVSGKIQVSDDVLNDLLAVAKERHEFLAETIAATEQGTGASSTFRVSTALSLTGRRLFGRDSEDPSNWIVVEVDGSRTTYPSLVAVMRAVETSRAGVDPLANGGRSVSRPR